MATECEPSVFESICCDNFFEWLLLKDLKALRLTCHRIKESVNSFIELNFPMALRKMVLYGSRLKQLPHIESVQRFELINNLHLQDTELKVSHIDGITQILSHVEFIQIDCTIIKCDIYEEFLKFCSNVKHLMMRGSSCAIIANGHDWLHQTYPSLEHIGVDDRFYNQPELNLVELGQFFELNPTVRHFSTTMDLLWNNRDWISKSNIQIDRLDIWNNFRSDIDIHHVCDLLNEVYEQRFYQRLYIYLFICDQEHLSEVSRLRALEGLSLPHYAGDWSVVPMLPILKELSLYNFPLRSLEPLSDKIPNICRISVCGPCFNTILPFVHLCPTLKQIKVRPLWYGAFGNPEGTDVIHLQSLNKTREELANAQKTTIFVNEEIYLKYKWNQETNLSLVELKRDQSWKQSNPFYRF